MARLCATRAAPTSPHKPELAKAQVALYLDAMTTVLRIQDRARLRERFYGAAVSLRARTA
jgi:hypothetical protein